MQQSTGTAISIEWSSFNKCSVSCYGGGSLAAGGAGMAGGTAGYRGRSSAGAITSAIAAKDGNITSLNQTKRFKKIIKYSYINQLI